MSKVALAARPATLHIHCDDAIAWTARAVTTGLKYDRILGLDCVYHFQTRADFIRHAAALLNPTGRLALTDLVLATPAPSLIARLALRIICILAGVPWQNMVSRDDYEATLRKPTLGLSDIQWEDVTEDVFRGLATFIERRGQDPMAMSVLDRGKWSRYAGFARILRWWSHGHIVRFVLVSAVKTR